MAATALDGKYSLRGPRTHRALAIEDAVLTSAAYGLFLAWHCGAISYLVFQVLMLVAIFRVFNLRHEKSHLSHQQFSRTWKVLTSLCWVFHSPYQEPYPEKRRKHVTHHKAHLVTRTMTTAENPHSLLEQKSFVRSFLTAVFYEEIMFYQDLKFHGGLSSARRQMMLVSTAVLAVLWLTFGGASLLGLIACYRVCMAAAWFSFSKMLHVEPFYGNPLLERLPRFAVRGVELILGSGAATALLAHEFHHHVPLKFHVVWGGTATSRSREGSDTGSLSSVRPVRSQCDSGTSLREAL